MKPYFLTLLPLTFLLCSCGGDDASSAYADLKAETGATDEELKRGIELFIEFNNLMQDEMALGTFDAQTMIDSAKNLNKVLDGVEREDQMAALMMLIALRTLEEEGADRAASVLVKHLQRFVDAGFPSNEQSDKLREKILAYAKDSEAFRSRASQGEQSRDDQPTAAESE